VQQISVTIATTIKHVTQTYIEINFVTVYVV